MNKIIYTFLSAFTFLSVNVGISQEQNIKTVTTEDAQLLLADGSILVDVREDAEITKLAFHVDGTIQIPLSQLEERVSELPKDKNLLIACRSGQRSKKAIKMLQSYGYENLANLTGGIKSWQANGYAVIVDGVKPATKACGSKKTEGKGCCSKKGQSKSSCDSKQKTEGKACCSKKGQSKSSCGSKQKTK
jgi:rhodanese-related sulfurtransferase